MIAYAAELLILKKYKIIRVKHIQIGPGGITSISGQLEPGACDVYGPLVLNLGSRVHVKLTWIPSTATLLVGLLDAIRRNYAYRDVTGGQANIVFIAWDAGAYYLFICDKSPYTVYYSGLVEIR
jgi:hypothetical protein